MTGLVGPNGQPIASPNAQEELIKRGQENFNAVLAVFDERKITNDELLDLVVNIFGVWCTNCAAGVFERNGNLAMNAFMTQIQRVLPLKQGELKIRANLAGSNPGAATTQ